MQPNYHNQQEVSKQNYDVEEVLIAFNLLEGFMPEGGLVLEPLKT